MLLKTGLLLFAGYAAFQFIVDLDIWWHLAAGKWMIENKSVVKIDTLSFTAEAQPWVSITWGYEVLIYSLYLLAGKSYWLINIFHALCAMLTIFFCWKTFEVLRQSTTKNLFSPTLLTAVAVFLIAICVAKLRWIHRPEMLSHFFGSLYLYLLTRNYFTQSRSPALFLIPVFQIFWVNMHGIFLAGPFLVLLFWINQKRLQDKLAVIFILTCLACLLNPRGLQGATFPFHLLDVLRHPFYSHTIPEATNPFRDVSWQFDTWSTFIWGILVMTMSALHAYYALFKKQSQAYPITFFLLAYLLIYFSISARRNIALLVLWTLPFVAHFLSQRAQFLWVKVSTATALLITLAISHFPFGGELTPYYYPERAVQFLKGPTDGSPAEGLRSVRVFSNVEFSDYALFHLPGFKSYIDGRFAEVYSLNHFQRYMDVLAHPFLIDDEVKKYNIGLTALSFQPPIAKKLVQYLANHKNWAVIYFDETAIVFIRNDLLNSYFPNYTYAKHVETLANQAENRLYLDKNAKQARVHLSEVLLLLNETELAQKILAAMIRLDSSFIPALVSSCLANYLSLEKRMLKQPTNQRTIEISAVQEIEDTCLRATSLDPKQTPAYQTLGLLYMNLGKFNDAIERFENVTKLDPLSFEGFFMLGKAHLATRNPASISSAKNAFEIAARLRPFDPLPQTELNHLNKMYTR